MMMLYMQVRYSIDPSRARVGALSSADEGQTMTDGSTRQLQVCSLSPLTLYQFAVSAITRTRHPGPAVERSYWTEASAPPVPPSPSLTGVMATNISLLLQPITSTTARPTSVVTYFVVVNDLSPAAVAVRRQRHLSRSRVLSLGNDVILWLKYCQRFFNF